MKKQKKIMFIQTWGTYPAQTVVCVGVTAKEIRGYLVRLTKPKVYPNVLKEFDEETIGLEKRLTEADGLFMVLDKSGASFLWLRVFDPDAWKDVEVLLHEIHHAVHQFSRQKGFIEEPEAQAYLFEFLFKEIRIGINKRILQ